MPDSTVRRWLAELVELEYLETRDEQGRPGQERPLPAADGRPAKDLVLGLLTPEDLREARQP